MSRGAWLVLAGILGLLAIPHLGSQAPLDAEIAAALRERLGFDPGFCAVRIEPGRRLVLRGVTLGSGSPGEEPPFEAAEIEVSLSGSPRDRDSGIRVRGARVRADTPEAIERLRRLRPPDSGTPVPHVDLRDATVLLPGGLELRAATGRVAPGEAGLSVRLAGALSGPALEGSGVRVQVEETAGHLAAEARSLRFHPAGVEIRAEDVTLTVRSVGGGSRIGAVHASRFRVQGVPGEELSAQLGADESGLWSAGAISGTLAGGKLSGRAAYGPGGERPVSADLSLEGASLAEVPSVHLGARSPLRGKLDVILSGFEWGRRDLRGELTAAARDVELSETPLLLGLLAAVQFRAESRPVFGTAEARAALERDRLRFSRLRLVGETLSLDLVEPGTVGWDGSLALPFRVSGLSSLFRNLPIFGDVVDAATKAVPLGLSDAVPIELRTSLGGSLRVPRVSVATGLRKAETPPRGR